MNNAHSQNPNSPIFLKFKLPRHLIKILFSLPNNNNLQIAVITELYFIPQSQIYFEMQVHLALFCAWKIYFFHNNVIS